MQKPSLFPFWKPFAKAESVPETSAVVAYAVFDLYISLFPGTVTVNAPVCEWDKLASTFKGVGPLLGPTGLGLLDCEKIFSDPETRHKGGFCHVFG